MRLVGSGGNASHLLGVFRVAAKFLGWSDEEIKAVLDEATGGDDDHLLATLAEYTEDPGVGDEGGYGR